jgi:hypothetical protein
MLLRNLNAVIDAAVVAEAARVCEPISRIMERGPRSQIRIEATLAMPW